ncbi:MAG TPA: DUF58 domain-containing protein [Usitatibacter sp.]|nr:DUF58 domain-containing protein [Usitatibacter sp.]
MSRLADSISASVARTGAPAFWHLWRLDRRMARKLTAGGWLIVGLAAASAVFGLNTTETLIYQVFGIAVSLLLVAAIASARLGARMAITRRLPSVATAGTVFGYTLSIRNVGRRAATSLEVQEVLGTERPAAIDFIAHKVHEDRERNLFDRLVGYPRWVSLMRMRLGARPPEARVETVAPGETISLALECVPLRRGVLRFDAVSLGRVEPLGLMRALRRVALPETLLVMPRTYPAATLTLPGARRLQPGGVAFAGRVGDAEEFMSLRDYRPGDTPRRIHWKAWARSGRPVVKEYQDEFFVRHALLLDTFSPPDAAAFEAAVSLAASLVMNPGSKDSLLDLMFVEQRAYTLTRGRGVGEATELLRVLASVTPSRGKFEELAEAALLGATRMSGALCVLLEWDKPRRDLVAALRGRGIPIRVWVVRAEAGTAALDPGPMASDAGNFRVVVPSRLAQELSRP